MRRHLKRLAAAGVVSARRELPEGRGRPRLRYRLVDLEAPRVAAHQELVRMLVGYLDHIGADPEDVVVFGRQEGELLGEPGGREAVLRTLSRLGFAPRELGGDGAGGGVLDLRLDSCPFREGVVAERGDLVCALHRGIAEGIAARAAEGGGPVAWRPGNPIEGGCRARFEGLADDTGQR